MGIGAKAEGISGEDCAYPLGFCSGETAAYGEIVDSRKREAVGARV